MNRPVFALVDCNNFFVSCERIFRPDLEGRPVVVLSSNDGCVVARSNEVKQLGVPMAAPAFKFKEIFKQHGVVQFSANFDLYGNISRRITDVLTTITPRIEVYSVDESFLDLSELNIPDYNEWGRMVRTAIWKWVGIPVSIGIAPTKTLAKLASDRAKKDEELQGVLSLQNVPEQIHTHYLQTTSIKDIWGIGWRLAPKIRAEGIMDALAFSLLRPQQAQQLMGIHGRQLVAELTGTSCYPLDRIGKSRKSIARTRTFGEDMNDLGSIEAALTTFATQAAFRLRVSGQVAKRAGLFLTTNRHKPGYRAWSREIGYTPPTADTGKLIGTLIDELISIYDSAQQYHRAGVFLYDFLPQQAIQIDLLGKIDVGEVERGNRRMKTIDSINEKFGKQSIRYASQDLGNRWRPRYNLRSPRYVTELDELPLLRPILAEPRGRYH